MNRIVYKYLKKSIIVYLGIVYLWGILSFEILNSAHFLSHKFSNSYKMHKIHDLLDHFNGKNFAHKHLYLTLIGLVNEHSNKDHDHKTLNEDNSVDNHLNPLITPSLIFLPLNILLTSSYNQIQIFAYSPITPPPQN